jgi:hypothetical protein
MADIYQCPRCGAITYRHGIKIHDAYHATLDTELTTLGDKVGETEGFELHNWPVESEPAPYPESITPYGA